EHGYTALQRQTFPADEKIKRRRCLLILYRKKAVPRGTAFSDLSLTTNFFIMWECSSLIKQVNTENAALYVFPQFPPT
ncbi:MAG: hypothetical protein IJK30_13675, partial [Ruminococcus sp.]|nr:hypothetical protein [Ruminococcus sp.]